MARHKDLEGEDLDDAIARAKEKTLEVHEECRAMRFLIYAEVPACGLNRETLRKLLESHLLSLPVCMDLAEDVNHSPAPNRRKTRTPCAPERIEFKVLP